LTIILRWQIVERCVLTVLALAASVLPASSQTAPAQSNLNPTALPTDITPQIFSGERSLMSRELKYSIWKKLPEKLWFQSYTEISQRLETNPQFLSRDDKPDYVFRALPNTTVGYNFLPNTGVYCNYFVLKDVFARFPQLGRPTLQSLSFGVQHTHTFGEKTAAQVKLEARELWQAQDIQQFDFLPNINLTRQVTPHLTLIGATTLQLRGGDYFVAPTREIDPFYSVQAIYSRGLWNFVASDTFVTNFRHPPFSNPIPQHGNVSMIASFEVNHPIHPRYLPGLYAFVRAEPVWNWDSGGTPGLSGFDFRLFSGIRIAVFKPPLNQYNEQMRKNIREYEKRRSKTQPQGPTGGLPTENQNSPAQTSSKDSTSSSAPVDSTKAPDSM